MKVLSADGLTKLVQLVKTTFSKKQDNLISGTNIKTINNTSLLGSGNITIGGENFNIPYGESTSAADATQKEVTISSITSLNTGQIIIVTPTITSTVADATLKLNNFTAYPILYGGAAITTSTDSITWAANYPSWFRFNGSNWVFLGHGADNNTTYSAMTTANGIAGTETTARLMRADRLKSIIQGTKLTGLSTSTNSAVVATDSIIVGIGKLQAQVNSKQATITSSNKLSASLVSGLATVATSGSYNDLSNKPTIPTVPTNISAFTNDSGYITNSALNGYATESYVTTAVSGKQDTLVSGTNIKTINNTSILGSGNIEVGGSPTWSYDSTTRTLTIS